MKDINKLISLLDSFDIGYRCSDNSITIKEGFNRPTRHPYSAIVFCFDNDGNFVEVGTWE